MLAGVGLEILNVGSLAVIVGFVDKAVLGGVLSVDAFGVVVHPGRPELEVEGPGVRGVEDDDDRAGGVGDEGELA